MVAYTANDKDRMRREAGIFVALIHRVKIRASERRFACNMHLSVGPKGVLKDSCPGQGLHEPF